MESLPLIVENEWIAFFNMNCIVIGNNPLGDTEHQTSRTIGMNHMIKKKFRGR